MYTEIIYTDDQIMSTIAGSKTLTNAACDVIRGAIEQAKRPFDPDVRERVLASAWVLDAFLPRAEAPRESATETVITPGSRMAAGGRV